tara:strand:+ start:31 stop:207 length:177 start_codon:yes stop_codon:yes gene_type:complete
MKYTMVILLALGIAGCGNTITGIGKDFTDVGGKVTKWQNTPAKEDVVVKKNGDSGDTE